MSTKRESNLNHHADEAIQTAIRACTAARLALERLAELPRRHWPCPAWEGVIHDTNAVAHLLWPIECDLEGYMSADARELGDEAEPAAELVEAS